MGSLYLHLMSNLLSLTSSQLKRAADLKDRIEALNQELAGLFGSSATVPTVKATAKRGRKKISAAGIAKIVAAQKARWAKVKSAAKGAAKPAAKASVKAPAKKRKMSAAARAKIAAAAKARWAKAKAAGRTSL
jgi:hypothetical protein